MFERALCAMPLAEAGGGECVSVEPVLLASADPVQPLDLGWTIVVDPLGEARGRGRVPSALPALTTLVARAQSVPQPHAVAPPLAAADGAPPGGRGVASAPLRLLAGTQPLRLQLLSPAGEVVGTLELRVELGGAQLSLSPAPASPPAPRARSPARDQADGGAADGAQPTAATGGRGGGGAPATARLAAAPQQQQPPAGQAAQAAQAAEAAASTPRVDEAAAAEAAATEAAAAEAVAAAERFEVVDTAMRAEMAKRAAARPAPASALAACAFALLLLLAAAACVASLAAAAWRAAAAATAFAAALAAAATALAAALAAAPFYCAFGERLRLAWIDVWFGAKEPPPCPRPARIDWRPERLRYLEGAARRERRWDVARTYAWARWRLTTPDLPPVTCDDLMWHHYTKTTVGDFLRLSAAEREWLRASLAVERAAAATADTALVARERDRFEPDPDDVRARRHITTMWTDNIRHWQKLLDACGDAA